MSKSQITFVIIPNARSAFRKYTMSQRLLFGVTLAVLLVGFLSSYALINNIILRSRLHALNSVEEENEELRIENVQMVHYAQRMREQICMLEETTTKLSVIVGIENDYTLPSDELSEGLGDIDTSQSLVTYTDPDTELPSGELYELKWQMDDLQKKSSVMEESLKDLEVYYQGRESELAHTPSISPVRKDEGYRSSVFGTRTDPFTKRRTFHRGIDISALPGTDVISPADGRVSRIFNDRVGGHILEVNHGDGIKTRYGHLKKYNVRLGETINRGEVIAFVGNSGRSTGPHLHYEIWVNDKPRNPVDFILD